MTWTRADETRDIDTQHAERAAAEHQEWRDAGRDDAGTYTRVAGRLLDVADLPSKDEL